MNKKKKHYKKEKTVERFAEMEEIKEPPREEEKAPRFSSEKQNKWKAVAWIFLAVVCVVLLYPRLITDRSTALTAGPLPDNYFVDTDSCYHARRILYVAQHAMRLPFYDPLLAYPQGAVPIWSPFHDLISALPSFVLSFGSPSDDLVLRTAGLLTVLFAFIQLFFYGLLVYKATQNKYLGILTALFIGSAVPQITFTKVSIVDHNSTLLMIFSVLLYKLYCVFRRENSFRFLSDTGILGLLSALLFWTWPGSYIYIAPVALIQFLYILMSKKTWLSYAFSISYLISTVLVLPLAIMHYTFSKDLFRFEYVSFSVVLFLGAAGLFFYALAQLFEYKTAQKKLLTTVKLSISVIALAICAYFLLTPFIAGITYASAQNKWLATVTESEPLFYLFAGIYKVVTFKKLYYGLGYLAFLFPVAFALIAGRWIKIQEELYCIFLVIGTVFMVLAIGQTKFLAEFSIPHGIAMSILTGSCYAILTKKKSVIPAPGAIAIIGILLIILLSPLTEILRQPGFSIYRASYPAFKWLKENVRIKDMPINSTAPEQKDQGSKVAGIMAPWEFGHHLQFYAQFPTVVDNFGYIYTDISQWQGFYDAARFYVSEDENEAIAILDKYNANYIFVSDSFIYENYMKLLDLDTEAYFEYSMTTAKGETQASTRPKDKFLLTIGFRLSELYGSVMPFGSDNNVPANFIALKHFRLLYELPAMSTGAGKPVPPGRVKVYQYVKGTPLQVPGNDNDYYTLEADIITNIGKTFKYRQKGYLKNKVIVPYPTASTRNYSTANSYRVTVNGSTYEFNDIPE